VRVSGRRMVPLLSQIGALGAHGRADGRRLFSRWNSHGRFPDQGSPVLVLFLGLGTHNQVLPRGGSTSALGVEVVPTSP
jgi:hypothetical protein